LAPTILDFRDFSWTRLSFNTPPKLGDVAVYYCYWSWWGCIGAKHRGSVWFGEGEGERRRRGPELSKDNDQTRGTITRPNGWLAYCSDAVLELVREIVQRSDHLKSFCALLWLAIPLFRLFGDIYLDQVHVCGSVLVIIVQRRPPEAATCFSGGSG
jgi:hypothetical protein